MFIDVLLQGCLMQIDLSLQDSELGHILANTVPDVLQLVVKLHIREFLGASPIQHSYTLDRGAAVTLWHSAAKAARQALSQLCVALPVPSCALGCTPT